MTEFYQKVKFENRSFRCAAKRLSPSGASLQATGFPAATGGNRTATIA